jgi:hypothetical protein
MTTSTGLHRTEQNGTKRSSALVTAAFSSTVFEWWKTAVSKHRTCLFGNEEPRRVFRRRLGCLTHSSLWRRSGDHATDSSSGQVLLQYLFVSSFRTAFLPFMSSYTQVCYLSRNKSHRLRLRPVQTVTVFAFQYNIESKWVCARQSHIEAYRFLCQSVSGYHLSYQRGGQFRSYGSFGRISQRSFVVK